MVDISGGVKLDQPQPARKQSWDYWTDPNFPFSILIRFSYEDTISKDTSGSDKIGQVMLLLTVPTHENY